MLFVTVALDKQYILDRLVTSMFATYYGLSSPLFVFTSLSGGLRSIEISMLVCLSVCPLAYLKNHMSKFSEIVAVAGSSSDESIYV